MGPSPNALKYQIIGTLHAAAYMRGAPRAAACVPPPLACSTSACCVRRRRAVLTGLPPRTPSPAVPLIVINTVVILVKLLFG